MAEKDCNSPPELKQHEQDKKKDDTASGLSGGSPQSKVSGQENASSTQGLTSPSSGGFSSTSSVSSKRKTSNPMAECTDDSRNILASDPPPREKPSDQCQRCACNSPQREHTEPSSEISTVAPEQSNQDATETGSSQTPGQNFVPPSDLLDDYKSYRENCLRLYVAALNGDVDEAKDVLGTDPSVLLGKAITKGCQTTFHVATGAKQIKFVKEMVKLLGTNIDPLLLQDNVGNNAFCHAAAAGTIQIAEIFLGKNENLLTIRGSKKRTPLCIAALFGERDMALFLYRKISKLPDILAENDRKDIFFYSIHNGWYDLAREFLVSYKNLALARDKYQRTALHLLAKTPSAFTGKSTGRILETLKKLSKMNSTTHESNLSTHALQLLKDLWEKILCQEYSKIKEFISTPTNLLFDAARLGNFIFLTELIRDYPPLVHELDEEDRSIFHIAIMHRHTATFNLIHSIGFDRQVIATYDDVYGNNLLHLAATYLTKGRADSMVPGAALEMQQELIMFKEVELLVTPTYREKKNSAGVTPRELFTEDHAELLKRGETWMKQTAKSCSLVAALIATGVFSAAFDLPGGGGNTKGPTDGEAKTNGTSVNLTKSTAFQIFAMADTVALTSSSISILMFLYILTSRYAEKDFLWSLPLKLVIGIAMLFISIVAMMLAFSSSFFLTFDQHRFKGRFPVTISLLVSLSVPVFVLLQYGLFRDILYSSFRFRFSIKPGLSTSLWTEASKKKRGVSKCREI